MLILSLYGSTTEKIEKRERKLNSVIIAFQFPNSPISFSSIFSIYPPILLSPNIEELDSAHLDPVASTVVPQTTFADHVSYNSSHSSEMSTGELLSIEPLELKFPFELKKQISCSIQLSNKTDSHVAFKVKTTNPKKYCVRPNTGVVLPRSTCDVIVTMQAQKEAPPDMQCKDKFLLQSVKRDAAITPKDITAEMFNKEAGHVVEECKLRVLYVPPPQPPSPVPEGSEEGSSPRASVSENGNVNSADFPTVTKAFTERPETQDKSAEAKALISRLTEEKNNAVQLNNKLRQELVLLKRQGNKNRGGVSIVFVILTGLLGIIMGYLMKKT